MCMAEKTIPVRVRETDWQRLQVRGEKNRRSATSELSAILDTLDALERGYNIPALLASLEPAPKRQAAMDAARKDPTHE
jgi:hypothetical protein